MIQAALSNVPSSLCIVEAVAEPLQLQAAEGDSEKKLKSFSMTAYTGGKMMLANFYYPVVVDLSGLKVSAKSRPILRDHDAGRIVGHTTSIDVNAGSLRVAGIVSAANSYATEVVESSANGFPWQASIGASVQKMAFVDKGETVEVNGRKFTGPVYVARQATLGEVSFVALGADDQTSASVAASKFLEKEETMGFEAWLKAKGFDPDTLSDAQEASLRAMFESESDDSGNVSASKQVGGDGAAVDPATDAVMKLRASQATELKRIAEVQKRADRHPEIAAKAIEEGWSPDRVELEVLRASRPTAPSEDERGGPLQGNILRAAVLQASGYNEEKAVKYVGEKAMQAAHTQYRGGLGLQQLILECAWSGGYTGRHITAGNLRDVLKAAQNASISAAVSTETLTNIFEDVANKMLLAGFESNIELETMRKITATKAVTDFKQTNSYRLTADMTYKKVGTDGQLKHGSLGELKYTNQADTYGIMYAITRKNIIDDDLSALADVPYEIGVGGVDALLNVFWTEFLDNASFFATGNKNYAAGSGTVLSIDSLTQFETLLLNQTKPNGNPLSQVGRYLLVPNALFTPANTFMRSTEIRDTTANTKGPVLNPHAGKYEVLRSSYLSDARISGYSTTAWYLLVDPARVPVIETVFLNGNQSPTVESAELDFNTLGIQMRGYHDFGVAKQEFRGGVKSKGAA